MLGESCSFISLAVSKLVNLGATLGFSFLSLGIDGLHLTLFLRNGSFTEVKVKSKFSILHQDALHLTQNHVEVN